jgi:hypothetical protein
VYSSRLRSIFESMQRRKASIAAQRIIRIAMRLTRAYNLFVVPAEHAIQKTHETGVRNERTDFRFIDRHILLGGDR